MVKILEDLKADYLTGEGKRRWLALVLDGGSLLKLVHVLEDNADKLMVIPGWMHTQQNDVRLANQLIEACLGSRIFKSYGFESPRAQELIRKVTNLHKAREFLELFSDALIAERVREFVRFLLNDETATPDCRAAARLLVDKRAQRTRRFDAEVQANVEAGLRLSFDPNEPRVYGPRL